MVMLMRRFLCPARLGCVVIWPRFYRSAGFLSRVAGEGGVCCLTDPGVLTAAVQGDHLEGSTMALWFRIVASVILALGLCAGAAAAAVPPRSHFASALWNNPGGLPALPENPSIHYEPGALEQARRVAAILPAALDRVAAEQGRTFAHPVIVGVYVSPDSFAAANGTGSPGVAGVTFMGRVTLSPRLFSKQPQRLQRILTHELSHAHLAGWIGTLATVHLPNWFKEGLAVMVSDGGGAEDVSAAAAREAILPDDRITVNDTGSWLHLSAVEFEREPRIPRDAQRIEMAYRQAGLFVTWLHDTDPAAFAAMLQAIEDARPFKDAVPAAYGATLPVLWSRFVAGLS
jgi:hypothetical protein